MNVRLQLRERVALIIRLSSDVGSPRLHSQPSVNDDRLGMNCGEGACPRLSA